MVRESTGEAKGVTVFFNVFPQFAPIFVGFTCAMGGNIDPRSGKVQKIRFDNSSCKGKKFAAYIVPDTYEGQQKNSVSKIAPYAEIQKLREAQQASQKQTAKK